MVDFVRVINLRIIIIIIIIGKLFYAFSVFTVLLLRRTKYDTYNQRQYITLRALHSLSILWQRFISAIRTHYTLLTVCIAQKWLIIHFAKSRQ